MIFWMAQQHIQLTERTIMKKAETNGSVVYLVVQIILCLNQGRISLHTKQGTNSCGEEAATEARQRIYYNINSLCILCPCLHSYDQKTGCNPGRNYL